MDFDSLDIHGQRACKRLLEMESGCGRYDIDAPWGNSDLENGSIRLQIRCGEIVQWSTETLQCAQYSISIAWRWHDPDVDIHRGAEITIGGQRISANEEKLSLLFD